MLRTLRSSSSNFFVKLMLMFLVASFALFGIENVFTGIRHQNVADVGDRSVSLVNYQQSLRTEIAQFQQTIGQAVSPEMAKAFGIPDKTLQRMIHQELLALEAESLGLEISDDQVVEQLRITPAFLDTNGVFLPDNYHLYLREQNMSERELLSQLRRDMARNIIMDALGTKRLLPAVLARKLYLYRNELRTAQILRFPPDYIKDVPQPTDTDLVGFFGSHEEQFKAPEYRTISYISLSLAELSKNVPVSQEEMQEAYDAVQDQFTVQEQRSVEQMLFDSEESAKAAYDQQTIPADKEFTFLGKMKHEELPEEARDIVFALKKDELSTPVKTAFGWHLFRVVEIMPKITLSLENVKDALKQGISLDKAREEMYRLTTKLEDSIAAGDSLAEAAKKLGLDAKTVGPIGQDGNRPDGSAATDLPPFGNFLSKAFEIAEGSEPEMVENGDNGSFVIHVDAITPARHRALDEVRGSVVDAWKVFKRDSILKATVEDAAKQLQQGAQIQDLSKRLGLSVTVTKPVKRSDSDNKILFAPAVQALFALKKGEATGAFQDSDGSYLVARVHEIFPADPTGEKEALAKLQTEITEEAGTEVLEQYFAYLRKKYPVTIHTDVQNQAQF